MWKVFPHNNSLFSKVLDLNRSLTELNTDLDKSMGLSMDNAV